MVEFFYLFRWASRLKELVCVDLYTCDDMICNLIWKYGIQLLSVKLKCHIFFKYFFEWDIYILYSISAFVVQPASNSKPTSLLISLYLWMWQNGSSHTHCRLYVLVYSDFHLFTFFIFLLLKNWKKKTKIFFSKN